MEPTRRSLKENCQIRFHVMVTRFFSSGNHPQQTICGCPFGSHLKPPKTGTLKNRHTYVKWMGEQLNQPQRVFPFGRLRTFGQISRGSRHCPRQSHGKRQNTGADGHVVPLRVALPRGNFGWSVKTDWAAGMVGKGGL